MATIPEEIQAIVEQLSPDYQRQVLEFAQRLVQTDQVLVQTVLGGRSLPRSIPPPGTPGSALPRFKLSSEDAEAMERAIMEDCEWTPDSRQ